jgi:small subunit ribosomal protein S9
MSQEKRYYATGRRKCSSARVYLSHTADSKAPTFTVNGKEVRDYFVDHRVGNLALKPLDVTERSEAYNVMVSVAGGGVTGQAQAIIHGLSRALQTAEPELRPTLKKEGFLRRDPRVVERKKPGRHKARKRPQFSKR